MLVKISLFVLVALQASVDLSSCRRHHHGPYGVTITINRRGNYEVYKEEIPDARRSQCINIHQSTSDADVDASSKLCRVESFRGVNCRGRPVDKIEKRHAHFNDEDKDKDVKNHRHKPWSIRLTCEFDSTLSRAEFGRGGRGRGRGRCRSCISKYSRNQKPANHEHNRKSIQNNINLDIAEVEDYDKPWIWHK